MRPTGGISTTGWLARREQRLEIDKHKCKMCGSESMLNVHHLSYENMGNEDIENDLVTLCYSCHQCIHIIADTAKPHVKKLANGFKDSSSKLLAQQADEYSKSIGSLVGTFATMFTGLRAKNVPQSTLLSLLIKQLGIEQPYDMPHVYAKDMKTSIWKEAQAAAKRVKEKVNANSTD